MTGEDSTRNEMVTGKRSKSTDSSESTATSTATTTTGRRVWSLGRDNDQTTALFSVERQTLRSIFLSPPHLLRQAFVSLTLIEPKRLSSCRRKKKSQKRMSFHESAIVCQESADVPKSEVAAARALMGRLGHRGRLLLLISDAKRSADEREGEKEK